MLKYQSFTPVQTETKACRTMKCKIYWLGSSPIKDDEKFPDLMSLNNPPLSLLIGARSGKAIAAGSQPN
jgi:hypothetical protein